MKKALLSLAALPLCLAAAAQCSVIEIPLQQRAASAGLIVEGKVVSRNSFWNTAHNMIYTANTIELYKVFKGNVSSSNIEVITEGGTVDYFRIKAEPSLELNVGEIGIFTLEHLSRPELNFSKNGLPRYQAYASVQGFIRYDLQNNVAHDVFRTYTDIEGGLYSQVLSSSSRHFTEVKEFSVSSATNKSFDPQLLASISGFSPTTVTAGTGTTITITGSGFGSTQGAGTVGFKNADDGGSTYITPLPSQYISWSNTQIVVEVPSNAGTGTIQVTQGVTTTSSGTLTVSYAHLNVDFDPGSGTIAYQTDHVDDNGSGGYTWRMNTGFDADASAKASFLRAFDSWRCNTGINWTIGSTTSINDAVSDGTNVICYDNTAPLSAGILGVCYSYWSGCASGPNIVWYVNELDIIFDEGSNISPLTWQFGPSLPSGSQYDFESVAVHELGHGHQLGHVISPGAIMHYALSNGSSNRTPGTNDLAGANFVQAKSIVANVCGPGAMTTYTCATAPVASFSGTPTTLCAGSTVAFTDNSTNTPTSWAWSFPGGTPSSSTAQNPTITYNTPGTYNVSLTATNSAGSDNVTMTGYITVNSCGSPPVASFSGTPTTVCAGGTVSFTDNSTNTPTSWAWTFSGGTPSSSTAQNPTITYSSPGVYNVSLTATNSFGSDAVTMTGYITVDAGATTSGTSVTNVTCNGGSNGAIDLTPSGGQSPYTFVWSPSGQTTEDRTGLTAGTYTVTITDNNGCTFTLASSVSQPTALSVNMSKTDATCPNNNGTATATPSGGTPTYSYAWSPGGQTTQVATGLASGSYTCTVTDNNGCTVMGSITVGLNCASLTQLAPAYCGITMTSLSQQLFCSAVSGATNYRYRVNGPGVNNVVHLRGNNLTNFYMTWITGVQYNATYTVEVASYNGFWTAYGSVCTVTTPATAPLTQLDPASCGITETSLSQQLFCNAVSGATNYRYRLNGPGVTNFVYTRGSNLTNFYMTYVTGVQYAGTYSIEVASYNGGWSAYGAVCTVTTPAFPTTQITNYCNMTTPAVSTTLTYGAITGATNYRWRVTNQNTSQVTTMNRGSNSTSWNLSVFSATVNTPYGIEVAALVGGVWGPYGPSCTVTTGPVMLAPADQFRMDMSGDGVESTLGLYPNPASEYVHISSSDKMASNAAIYNSVGDLLMTVKLLDGEGDADLSELSSGIYLVMVRTENGVMLQRLIK